MTNKKFLAFGKKNYRLMLLGICFIVLGLYIMSIDKEEYGFGLLGLTLGPIILMIGFIIQFFAIFAKNKP